MDRASSSIEAFWAISATGADAAIPGESAGCVPAGGKTASRRRRGSRRWRTGDCAVGRADVCMRGRGLRYAIVGLPAAGPMGRQALRLHGQHKREWIRLVDRMPIPETPPARACCVAPIWFDVLTARGRTGSLPYAFPALTSDIPYSIPQKAGSIKGKAAIFRNFPARNREGKGRAVVFWGESWRPRH